jgi:5-methylcytosine-specific restriction endonuclease McrA
VSADSTTLARFKYYTRCFFYQTSLRLFFINNSVSVKKGFYMIKICDNCNKEFNSVVYINNKRRNMCNRKFCLDCSPFGKRNTRSDLTKPLSKDLTERKCSKCEVIKPISDFYKKNKQKGPEPYPYCKTCINKITVEKQQKFKKICVEYKGGGCSVCGYDNYLGALEFHHINPKQKDFSPSKYRRYNQQIMEEKIKHELDKCVLLCANCHREAHAKINGVL